MLLLRAAIAAITVVVVAEVANRWPRLGALLLTLPVVSILAFVTTWQRDQDLGGISRMARETLILVPLGLPFFVPLAFAQQLGLGFWTASGLGLLLAATAVGLWFSFGPRAI